MSRPPAKKRTPSILVTDVRTTPPSRKAPFGNKRKHVTPEQLNNISVDNILFGSSDIPSGRKRSVPKFIARQREQAVSPMGVPSSMFHSLPGHSGHNRAHTSFDGSGSASASGSSFRGGYGGTASVGQSGLYQHGTPAQMTTNIPSRTTKLSQKLVLIPDNEQSQFYEEDVDEFAPPPTPWDQLRSEEGDTAAVDEPRRSYAERYPKDRRTDKFPRVTAYCISTGIRLQEASDFLRANHKVRPRIYDEAVFAPYFLPLLPGCGEGSRIKSSPGGVQMLEQLIDLSEQGDHHFEYFSGLERNEELHGLVGSIGGPSRSGNDENEVFDPSEPQDFSPRVNSYIPHEEAVAEVVARHQQKYTEEGLEQAVEETNGHTSANAGGAQSSDPKPYTTEEEFPFDWSAQDKSESSNGSSPHNSPTPPETAETETTTSSKENREAPKSPLGPNGYKIPAGAKATSPTSALLKPRQSPVPDALNHAELFIFSYGVVVFWNFTEQQEKAVLADLTFGGHAGKSIVVRPIGDNDIETEEMHFTYSPNTMKPRIYNDMITLRSGDHMIKLAMSHALAQSTKLSRFEARMDGNMHDVKHVPRTLALVGKLGMKREDVLKISGELFRLRVDVNLSSNVLDTPEFFWESEPSLNPLYTAIREYLEIDQRVLVLNERCKVFLELTDIIADSIAESNMSRITWIIIILIALSLGVSAVEIVIRFTLLKNV